MQPFVVREARRPDVPSVVRLWKEMMDFHGRYDPRFRFAPDATREFEKHAIATMRSRGARIYVADAGDSVVGYILAEVHDRQPIYPIGHYGFISDISVTEAWRRRGVGRALVLKALEWLRGEGVTAIELFAAEANPVSVAFWREMGFCQYLRLLRLDLDAR